MDRDRVSDAGVASITAACLTVLLAPLAAALGAAGVGEALLVVAFGFTLAGGVGALLVCLPRLPWEAERGL